MSSAASNQWVYPLDTGSKAHLLVPEWPTAEALRVSSADHHHLARVLRLRAGELVTATNGRGAWRAFFVPDRWESNEIPLVSCGAETQVHRTTQRTVAFSLVKSDKPETVVQKLTELGISRIVLLAADHSVVRWDNAKASKQVERLLAIAREAVMQSRGVWIPTLEGPLSVADFVGAETRGGRRVFPADMGGTPWHQAIECVAIGPEGGWSRAERGMFFEQAVSLTDGSVLRAETAAIAAGVLLSL